MGRFQMCMEKVDANDPCSHSLSGPTSLAAQEYPSNRPDEGSSQDRLMTAASL